VVSVLTAPYPVTTIVLARIVLASDVLASDGIESSYVACLATAVVVVLISVAVTRRPHVRAHAPTRGRLK